MENLSFNSSSPYMIYSNYPEVIHGNTVNSYTTKADITANRKYTVFFYHANWSATTKRIGVAIKNTGSSSLSVTYYGGGMLSGSSALDNCATLASYCVNGTNGTSLRTVSNLAVGSTAFLAYNDSVAPTYSVGKFIFKTNQTAEIRIFHGPNGVSSSTVFGYTQDGYSNDAGDSSRIAAAGIESVKTVAEDIECSDNPTFKLFEYPIIFNDSEYQPYSDYLYGSAGSEHELWGNYEQTYTLTFSGAAGKKLRLTPTSYPARILTYSSASGVWTLHDKISSGSFNDISLGSNDSATVKIILCGGNSGNFAGSVLDE